MRSKARWEFHPVYKDIGISFATGDLFQFPIASNETGDRTCYMNLNVQQARILIKRLSRFVDSFPSDYEGKEK